MKDSIEIRGSLLKELVTRLKIKKILNKIFTTPSTLYLVMVELYQTGVKSSIVHQGFAGMPGFEPRREVLETSMIPFHHIPL